MSADSKDRGAPPLTQTPGPAGADHTTIGKVEPQPVDLPTWGSLERLELIGSGGFGRVFRAWDPTLARAVALKIIHIPEPDAARSVLREGQLLARLRHKNIVTVFGAQQKDDEIGILMELVRGRSLADIVEQDGPLGPDEASVVGVSLCQALAAVHAAGLVHRDVKARNVMRESGGRIVLMDFGAGLDRGEAHESTGSHMLTGTPLCMAPEVLLGHPASPISDIYSLGVLLFYLMTARHPVEGKSLRDIVIAHSTGQRIHLTDVRPDVPVRFVQVVDRALAANVEERYSSAGKMMRDLLDFLPSSGTASISSADAASLPGRSGTPADSARGAQPASDRTSGRALAQPETLESRVLVWSMVAGATVLGVWLLGFLSSIAFNNTLGRSSEFANETPLDWLVWGVRALIAPALYMAIAAIPVVLLTTGWRLLSRVSSHCHAFEEAARRRLQSMRLDDPVLLGQILFAVEVVLLYLVWRRFSGLILSVATYATDAGPIELNKLAPSNIEEHILYGRVLDVLILAIGIAWYWILRMRRREGADRGRPSVVFGLSILAILVLLLVLPYKIIWHNDFERVTLGTYRCYLIGERPSQLLLYCPDVQKPKNRVIPTSDPTIHRESVFESVFTQEATR